MASTRDRLLAEGMRLFGEQGYASTSVAQIEAAAGLSPGSGSMYKHFRSKKELLAEGMERLLSGGRTPVAQLGSRDPAALAAQLTAAARAGLRRMDEDRDLSRLLFRGLDAFPDLLARFGDGEIGRFHRAITAMLTELAGDGGETVDWAAIAVVLQGATAHYWLLADLFDRHPTGVDEDRFVAAAASLVVALLAGPPSAGPVPAEAARQIHEPTEGTR
ncbi:TetR/AcrR family transcriptional regulator [Pseudonocardia asaccharolytica]|nr:TetR/AcrR family transcriptional regulator [Pseudonocardia asaccharolytica]